MPVRSGHTAGKHPSAESIQTTQPHSVEGWARPVTSSHTSMRRHQLLLVGLILNSVLADLCNQTTGTAGGCSGQSQECVESNLGVGGNCYCTGTCFLNGACTEIQNAYCIFNTTPIVAQSAIRNAGISAAVCLQHSDRHCAGHSATCSNRQVR